MRGRTDRWVSLLAVRARSEYARTMRAAGDPPIRPLSGREEESEAWAWGLFRCSPNARPGGSAASRRREGGRVRTDTGPRWMRAIETTPTPRPLVSEGDSRSMRAGEHRPMPLPVVKGGRLTESAFAVGDDEIGRFFSCLKIYIQPRDSRRSIFLL